MIIGLSGAIGSGKSHTQLKIALEYAERKQKMLVCNFSVNVRAIYEYAKLKKYHWVQWLCLRGCIIQITAPKRLEALLIPESVVCLDEAGIFLNSREFASTSKQLLADLAQSRKDGVDLVWAAQFNEQVDKQVRMLTQYWIHCDSVSVYDRKLRRPKLVWKRIYWMTAWDYNYWVNDPRARSSHFKTRFAYGFSYEGGFLNRADKLLFRAFNSFSRLDQVKSRDVIRTLQRCELPADYFYRSAASEVEASSIVVPAADLQSVDNHQCRVPQLQVTSSRSQLIRSALALARSRKIEAPYFKSLTDSEIKAFISKHSVAS